MVLRVASEKGVLKAIMEWDLKRHKQMYIDGLYQESHCL